MAGSGSTPPEAEIVDMLTWVEKGEYERAKEKAIGFSSTITGMKGDLTLMKGEIAGLALGMTAVKVDFTLLKVDEKGVSWRGRQLVGFKFADEAKSFQAKMERTQRKLGRAQKDMQKKLDAFERFRTRSQDAAARSARANRELEEARNRIRQPNWTAADLERFHEAEREAAKAQKELKQFEKKYSKAKGKAEKIRDWAAELKQKIAGLKSDQDEAKDKFKRVAADGEAKLNDLQAALDRAARSA